MMMKRILVRVRGPFPAQFPARVPVLAQVPVQDVLPCLVCLACLACRGLLLHWLSSSRIRECPVSVEVWWVWPVWPSV